MQHKGHGVVIAGTGMMLMMGIAYVWSVYVPLLIAEFGWSKTQASLPFSIFLTFYTVGMIVGGRLQDRYGPRLICTIGAAMFGLGYLLSGFATSLIFLCLVYGVVAGMGTGFAYVTPMASVIKWFPKRKGLIGGIVVFGFGAGAFIFAPVVRRLITAYDWQTTFITLGVGFTVLGIIASRFIVPPPPESPPPPGSDPEISDPSEPSDAPLAVAVTGETPSSLPSASVQDLHPDVPPSRVMRTPIFWLAWSAWMLALTVGLGLMGHIVTFAMELGIEEMAAAIVISVIAIANGAGRIVVGGLSDVIGRARSLAGACFVMVPVLAGLTWFGSTLPLLYGLGAVFGLCFGTWLVLYPMLASDLFGNKHLGINYGLLFSSYGVGGFIGPPLFGAIHDTTGTYHPMMLIAMALCTLAGGLAAAVHVLDRKTSL